MTGVFMSFIREGQKALFRFLHALLNMNEEAVISKCHMTRKVSIREDLELKARLNTDVIALHHNSLKFFMKSSYKAGGADVGVEEEGRPTNVSHLPMTMIDSDIIHFEQLA